MKTKIIFAAITVLVCSAFCFAQSVTITPKKMTYRRAKPLTDYKKSFTVTYAKVKAATPALSKKIEQAISYEKTNNLNVNEEKTEIQWLEEATYEVNYNKNGVLTITNSLSGTGAYPSVYNKTVVVDLQTGTQITPQNAFTNLPKLTSKIKAAQKAEAAKTIKEMKADPENKDFDSYDLFENAEYKAENLAEFAVDDKGVTFIFDYGFPHVVMAYQPNGRYFVSWAEMKPFIKRGGLLAKFVR